MTTFEPGTIVDGRYEILLQLGEGGMGTVYKAREIDLQRTLALKMLQPAFIGDEEHRQRFFREGKVLSSLSHPNLLKVYRIGIWDDCFPYIAMEFLSGTTLRSAIDHRHLTLERSLKLAMQICEGMQVVHAAGIVHRDLKPDNVMLVDVNESSGEEGALPSVKIVDFGLARILGESSKMSQHLTQTGALVGSVYYMSPEQCTGKRADSRSDIYALGCILFEAITGDPPFSADNPIGLMHKHSTEPVPSLPSVPGAKFPPGLDNLICKAMSKEPSERYQTMHELRDDIMLICDNRGAEIASVGAKPKARSHAGAIAVALLIAAAASLAVTLTRYNAGTMVLRKPHTSTAKPFGPADSRTVLRRAHLATEATVVQPFEQAEAELLRIIALEKAAIENIPESDKPLKLQGYLTESWTYRRLGLLTRKRSPTDEAEKLCLQAMAYAGGANAKRGLAAVLIAQGQCASDLRDFKRAIACYERAFHLISTTAPCEDFVIDSRLAGNQNSDIDNYLRLELGQVFFASGDDKTASRWFNSAIDRSSGGAGMVTSNSIQSMCCYATVLARQKRPQDATKLVSRGLRDVRRQLACGQINKSAAASFLASLSAIPLLFHDLEQAFSLDKEAVSYLDASADHSTFYNLDKMIELLKTYALQMNKSDVVQQAQVLLKRVNELKLRKSS